METRPIRADDPRRRYAMNDAFKTAYERSGRALDAENKGDPR